MSSGLDFLVFLACVRGDGFPVTFLIVWFYFPLV